MARRPATHFEKSSFVFAGTVLSTRDSSYTVTMPNPDSTKAPHTFERRLSIITFSVSHVWKGTPRRTVVVDADAGFGRYLDADTPWVVYTSAHGGRLLAGDCSRKLNLRHAYWERMMLEPVAVYGEPLATMDLETLFTFCRDPDLTTRHHAFETARYLADDRNAVLVELSAIVRGDAPGYGTDAMRTLALMGEAARPAAPAVYWAFDNSDAPMRVAALDALRTIGDRAAFASYVRQAMEDGHPDVRMAALRATMHLWLELDDSECRRLRDDIVAMWNDPHGGVRQRAISAVTRCPCSLEEGQLDELVAVAGYDPDRRVRRTAAGIAERQGRQVDGGIVKRSPCGDRINN